MRVGRNAPCPCGSGSKYKQCCLPREEPHRGGASPAPSLPQVLQAAIGFHRAGDLARAAELYRQILRHSPRHPDALHLLGVIAHRAGRLEEAVDLICRAIGARASEPGFHSNLGLVYRDLGRTGEAAACYRKALALAPDFAEAACNLGLILADDGRVEEAVDLYRRAIAAKPELAEAHLNLGSSLNRLDRLDEADVACRRALALRPDYVEAWCVLGNINQKRHATAPALACFQQALAIRPAHGAAACNAGIELIRQERLDEAEAALRRALEIDSGSAEAHYFLGFALLLQGRREESLAQTGRALALQPDYASAHDTRLFALLYSASSTREAIFAAHREYGERIEGPLRAGWRPHGPRDAGRRLRIGYLSPDFRRHSVAFFAEPLIARHDRIAFEVFCYYNGVLHDEFTERFIAAADHWVPCHHLGDDALAERIRGDGIDILVDLAGHSGNNRLPVFARRPAPLQVTWLGYPETTGLTAIDYRLTTADVDPPGGERWHSERLWRLPRTLWCYRPPVDDASPPAARTGDGVTFGSMNNLSKLTLETLALWAQILGEVPGARLVMTGIPEGSARRRLLAHFAGHGVEQGRVMIHGKLAAPDFQALLGDIDVALDPFPYNGTTTTCEALWRGIPVVTLVGSTSVSRSGHALLEAVGLAELCAPDPAGYVRIATALARDPLRRGELRASLRERMRRSPLRDEEAFAQDVERAWRDMAIRHLQ